MRNKLWLGFFVMLSFGWNVNGQSLSREVIASLGGQDFSSPDSISLSWTVGEIATETYENSDQILTQGFQQRFKILVDLEELVGENHYQAKPNPVSGHLTIYSPNAREHMIEVFNFSGIRIIEKSSDQMTDQIDFSNYPAGIYYVRIVEEEFIQLFTIKKTNI